MNAGRGSVDGFLGDEARRTEAGLEEQKITIRETKGQSSFSQTEVANDGSRSGLGEKEVFLSERKAAEEEIERQDVPPGYRDYVRRYFDGLEPAEEDGR